MRRLDGIFKSVCLGCAALAALLMLGFFAQLATAGADAFLVKPVPLRELVEVAELLMEGRRAPHATR